MNAVANTHFRKPHNAFRMSSCPHKHHRKRPFRSSKHKSRCYRPAHQSKLDHKRHNAGCSPLSSRSHRRKQTDRLGNSVHTCRWRRPLARHKPCHRPHNVCRSMPTPHKPRRNLSSPPHKHTACSGKSSHQNRHSHKRHNPRPRSAPHSPNRSPLGRLGKHTCLLDRFSL